MLNEKQIAIVTRLQKSFGNETVEVNSYDEAVIKVGNRPFITVTFNQGAYNVYCPDYGFFIDKYYDYNTYLSNSLIHEIREKLAQELAQDSYDYLSDEWVVA